MIPSELKKDLADFAEFLKNKIPSGTKPPYVFTFQDKGLGHDSATIESCLAEIKRQSKGGFRWSKQPDKYDSATDYGASTTVHHVDRFQLYTVHITNAKLLERFLPRSSKRLSSVEHIIMAPIEDGKAFWMVVNRNFENPIKVRGSKWSKLHGIANGEMISARSNKTLRGHLNSDPKSALYTQSHCKPSTIVRVEDGLYKPAIEIEPITFATMRRKIPKDTVLE